VQRALAALAGAGALAAPVAGARCSAELRLGSGAFVDGERGPLDGALVGSWRRVEITNGSASDGRAVETTWTFATEGDVAQQVVARNLNGTLIQGTTRRGRWRTEGGVVVVEFTTPAVERRQYAWRIDRSADGERLLLDGVTYSRVTG